MRRTRIVCTLGPASSAPAVLRAMIQRGMDVARLNFSHGDPSELLELARLTRELARAAGRHVALLQDLPGPKIRTGEVAGGARNLRRGETVVLAAAPRGQDALVVEEPRLLAALRRRDQILIQDGEIELSVVEVGAEGVRARVVHGGRLRSHQGVVVPTRDLGLPALTDHDRELVELGQEVGFDYVALSFVRRAEDVTALRRHLEQLGAPARIVAKLERADAIRNLDAILDAADAVMVARGDLGVELPLADVPAVQKNVIERANHAGRPVITATEMLESMVHAPRPTRAEASDVANAIWDGTDAVMLSQETSIGDDPKSVVGYMDRICRAAERHPAYRRAGVGGASATDVSNAMAKAAAAVAHGISARAIVAFTETGASALRVSKQRPTAAVIAASPHPATLRRTALYAGVRAVEVPAAADTDQLIDIAIAAARRCRLVRPGDRVVVVAGTPIGQSGLTNLIRVAVEPAAPDALS